MCFNSKGRFDSVRFDSVRLDLPSMLSLCSATYKTYQYADDN